ncbi:hypothetical protein D3C76_898600 [compost metagenome]
MGLALLQCWQARFDGRDLGGRFGDIEVGCDAVGQAQLRQLQAMAGDVEVLFVDGAGILHTAQLNVVLGGFGQHRQQHAATVVFRDFQGGIGGFGFAAHPAPEIQLPRGGEPGIPKVERGVTVMPRRVAQAFTAVAFTGVTAANGAAGITIGRHHLAHRTALLQAAAGELEVEVVGQGTLSEGRELRIVEHLPPTFVHGLGYGLAGGGF